METLKFYSLSLNSKISSGYVWIGLCFLTPDQSIKDFSIGTLGSLFSSGNFSCINCLYLPLCFILSFHFYRWLLNLLTFSSMALNLFIFNIFYVFVFCMSWEVSLTLLLTLIWPSVLSILLFDSCIGMYVCLFCFAIIFLFSKNSFIIL